VVGHEEHQSGEAFLSSMLRTIKYTHTLHPRDPRRLESGPFDVAIIGGGICGLALAYEAASRGLATALVEAVDFGSGVSFNQQKTAHGGLRTLQTGRLDRARESIRERRALARIAPHLLRPLPFVIGTYRSLTRNRAALRAAFLLDRLLGADRNAGIAPELRLPTPRLMSRSWALDAFPGIDPHHLTGGALWYDYQMTENDRLTLAFAAAADRAGAVLANYVAATAAIRDGGRIAGIVATDTVGGRQLEIRATLTINAAGGSAGKVMSLFGVQRPLPMIRVMSLMTSKPAAEYALAAPTQTGKMLTLVPWRGCALVGTSHSNRFVPPADEDVSSEEINSFIAEANEAFPALKLTRGDVTLVHRGLVPARLVKGHPDLKPSAEILDHAAGGAPGALTVVSVKYTTARGVAERVIDRAGSILERKLHPSLSERTALPGASIGDHEALVVDAARRRQIPLPHGVAQRLARLYGDTGPLVIAIMASHPPLAQPLQAEGSITGAEVVHAIRNEMAIRLPDIVLRRLALSMAHPGVDVLHACAAVAAAELGWTDEQRREQIAAVERSYQIP
jgi:glycerol-3-phosphate dehydrogenase